MRKFYFLTMSFLLIAITTNLTVTGQTNKTALRKFAIEKSADFKKKKAEAIAYAKANNIPVTIETGEIFMELMFIDELGQPQYYMTNNSNASATISTNKVNSGGSAGLNLDGSGMDIYEWDAGAVRATHQEFGGRVTQMDNAPDNHHHATHVGGTLIASGVQSAAKGMASAANLKAYDWNNDESEMASAASNGALVSNHSYGYQRGWSYNLNTGIWSWYGNPSISTQEDYKFGFYDSHAKDWDIIAKEAPYYLILKAAGNDRGDGPSNPQYPLDGPYDCIGNGGNAKNILTVGAVYDIPNGYSQPSDVTMSTFSSWGPSDDGRIKPDICANGVSVYSTYEDYDTHYSSISGTSMATPSATGSLILLQEHYQNLNGMGNFMRAATLKALVLHTADEAGPNPGPDYMFGWGLLNTESAAAKITENQTINVIDELSLNNGGSYTRTVSALGGQPLVVTIVWTDIEGTPVAASLDPTNPMIVNELDLRLTKGSNTYYPWSCNNTNHSAAATRNSENNVDNVEMVTIDSPSTGTQYTITVDHDGTLSGGSQAFSIVISGIGTVTPQPPVANFSASSEAITIGESVTFTDLSSNGPTSWNWTFAGGTPASSTAQNPTVTYNTVGTFDVSLTATNAQGSDTKTITNYIAASTSVCSYCDINYSNTSDDYISNVSLNTISNSSASTKYSDFTSISTNLARGTTHELSVDVTVNGSWIQHTWAWFDWNGNCNFDDDGEAFDLGQTPEASGTYSLTADITIPVDANLGTTRMRIAEHYASNPTTCQTSTYGEAEDYTVNIVEGGSISVPGCALVVSPTNTATDVAIATNLEWSSVTTADSYKLFFGSDNPPTNIANDIDVGNVTSYNPANDLINSTTYYWKVVPYNTGGDATGCSTWSFTTVAASSGGGIVELSYTNFETSWDVWTDGGGDCKRTNSGYSPQGNYSADIQDNSGVASSFFHTNGVDVHTDAYVEIKVEFTFQAISMDNSSEDFWVQYFDGSNWYTVADFDKDIDFENGSIYAATVSIMENDYTFPTNMKLRFMCDASGNRDDIYVDEIRISASDQIMNSNYGLELISEVNLPSTNAVEFGEELMVYPNPVGSEHLTISSPNPMKTIKVYNMMGENIETIEGVGIQTYNLNTTNYKSGIYILQIESEDNIEAIRFIKK